MTGTAPPVRAAVATPALSALAGLIGGPWLAAAAGFAFSLPVRVIAVVVPIAVMIWLDPITGVWLAVSVTTAIGGFILGAVRKPPPGLTLIHCRDDSGQTIAQLRAQLALASQRERALLAALTRINQAPPALPAPIVRGQVTG
jgi:hypothetical protein